MVEGPRRVVGRGDEGWANLSAGVQAERRNQPIRLPSMTGCLDLSLGGRMSWVSRRLRDVRRWEGGREAQEQVRGSEEGPLPFSVQCSTSLACAGRGHGFMPLSPQTLERVRVAIITGRRKAAQVLRHCTTHTKRHKVANGKTG